MDIPTPEIRSKFGAGAADQVVDGKVRQFFLKKPDDHFRILRTAPGNVILDSDVVFPAFPGSENARHTL